MTTKYLQCCQDKPGGAVMSANALGWTKTQQQRLAKVREQG
jgi:hypothetical protein